MRVYTMEDLRIKIREGRAAGTGNFTVTRNGNRKEITKYTETYLTEAGRISPEQWVRMMKECVEASDSQELLQRIIDHVERDCAWLKKDKDREEYALEILASRIYKGGRAWSDFTYDDLPEHTAFIFDFKGAPV